MFYSYEKNGQRKDFDFPIGKAPKIHKGYKRVIEFPPVHFGKGFSRSNIPPDLKPKITETATLGKMTKAEYDAA
jgi:hypothetical protein